MSAKYALEEEVSCKSGEFYNIHGFVKKVILQDEKYEYDVLFGLKGVKRIPANNLRKWYNHGVDFVDVDLPKRKSITPQNLIDFEDEHDSMQEDKKKRLN